jgi:hypothetical protein
MMLAGMLVLPAIAGRELDNRGGLYDGHYTAESVRVREDDKDDVTFERVPMVLEGRYVSLNLGDQLLAKARVDQMYDTGFKTEITATDTQKDVRYMIKLKGSMHNQQGPGL